MNFQNLIISLFGGEIAITNLNKRCLIIKIFIETYKYLIIIYIKEIKNVPVK